MSNIQKNNNSCKSQNGNSSRQRKKQKNGKLISQLTHRLNIFKKFLFFCAGLEGVVVQESALDVEHSKYISVGATVLVTAVLATLSGGYALFTAFGEPILSIIFGIFWGGVILNIDRLVILNMRADENKNWLQRLLPVLPRLLLAVIVGYIVSEPLKLRLFEKKIKDQVYLDNSLARQKRVKQLQSDTQFQILERRLNEAKQRSPQEQLRTLQEREQDLSDKLLAETGGTGITGIEGFGPKARQIRGELIRIREEIKKVKANLISDTTESDKNIEAIEKQVTDYEKKFVGEEKSIETTPSFLDSYIALERIAKEERIVFWISSGISVLFIILEIVPVFMKLQISNAQGPYELLLDAKEEESRKQAERFKLKIKKDGSIREEKIKARAKKSKQKIRIESQSDLEELSNKAEQLKNNLESMLQFSQDNFDKVRDVSTSDLENELLIFSQRLSDNIKAEINELMQYHESAYTNVILKNSHQYQQDADTNLEDIIQSFNHSLIRTKYGKFDQIITTADTQIDNQLNDISLKISQQIITEINSIFDRINLLLTKAVEESFSEQNIYINQQQVKVSTDHLRQSIAQYRDEAISRIQDGVKDGLILNADRQAPLITNKAQEKIIDDILHKIQEILQSSSLPSQSQ